MPQSVSVPLNELTDRMNGPCFAHSSIMHKDMQKVCWLCCDRVGHAVRRRTQGADIAQPQAALRLVPYSIAVRMHLFTGDRVQG